MEVGVSQVQDLATSVEVWRKETRIDRLRRYVWAYLDHEEGFIHLASELRAPSGTTIADSVGLPLEEWDAIVAAVTQARKAGGR